MSFDFAPVVIRSNKSLCLLFCYYMLNKVCQGREKRGRGDELNGDHDDHIFCCRVLLQRYDRGAHVNCQWVVGCIGGGWVGDSLSLARRATLLSHGGAASIAFRLGRARASSPRLARAKQKQSSTGRQQVGSLTLQSEGEKTGYTSWLPHQPALQLQQIGGAATIFPDPIPPQSLVYIVNVCAPPTTKRIQYRHRGWHLQTYNTSYLYTPS